MLDLVFVLLLTVGAGGVALRVVRRCGSGHPADDLALAVPLGLGILALATLGLAELGVLSLPGLGLVLGVGIVLGRPRGGDTRHETRDTRHETRGQGEGVAIPGRGS